jgi:Ni,Fe-hydrogenase III small subunit
MRRTLIEGLTRLPLTEKPPAPCADALAELAARVDGAARRRLGRSLSIREVDAGSCNGCELEIHALNNAFYDLERFGLRLVASPRHADVLLVTGPVTRNMREALERTWSATPDPKWVVAVGNCAVDGGVFAGSYAVAGLPPWCRSIYIFAVARRRRPSCSGDCWRSSTRRAARPALPEGRFKVGFHNRSLYAGWRSSRRAITCSTCPPIRRDEWPRAR